MGSSATPLIPGIPGSGSAVPAAASVPAGGMSASASLGSLNPFIRVPPIREINITTAMINSLNNDSSFKHLDMTLDNYAVWAKSLLEIFELNDLSNYVHGKIAEPAYDQTTHADNSSYWAYLANNRKIVAFIKVNISDLEKPFVKTELAVEAWDALKDRHIGRGPIVQTSLIQEAFAITFGPDVAELPDLTRKMTDIVGRIYAPGLPTQDVFLMVALLNALETHHPTIGADARTQYTNNPSTGSSWLLSRISQEVVWKNRSNPPADVALVAKAGGGRPVCAACNSSGHSKRTCWQVGGDMYGKEAEQRELIRKRREEGGGRGRGGKPGGASGQGAKADTNPFRNRQTTDGRAYVIDAQTKEAVFISHSNASDSTAPSFPLPFPAVTLQQP